MFSPLNSTRYDGALIRTSDKQMLGAKPLIAG
jgi:hypothetical protein